MTLWESITNVVVEQGLSNHPAIVSDEAELTYGGSPCARRCVGACIAEDRGGPRPSRSDEPGQHSRISRRDPRERAARCGVRADRYRGDRRRGRRHRRTDREQSCRRGQRRPARSHGSLRQHRSGRRGGCDDGRTDRQARATIGRRDHRLPAVLVGHDGSLERRAHRTRGALLPDAVLHAVARAGRGRSHALRCAAEPPPRIGNPCAADAAGGWDAVLEVAEVRVPALHPRGDRAPPHLVLQLGSRVLRRRGEAVSHTATGFGNAAARGVRERAAREVHGAGISRPLRRAVSNRSTGSRSCTRSV